MTSRRTDDRPWLAGAAFLLAVLVRLVPMLRGGGLRGYGSYDDSVYYASAVGLVHGRLPYRDFLLLQPPGVVVLLAPFAAIGRLVGEADGLALGRLAWMIMGGLTAAGIVILLRPLGRAAAITGAAFYAFFWPAAMVERVTDLEAPQNLALVIALLLLRTRREPRAETIAAVLAGVAIGISLGVKIWAVLPLVVLAVSLIIARRFRALVGLLVASIVVAAASYLPFFVGAPVRMWQMVVLDQFGRRRLGTGLERVEVVTGTTQLVHGHPRLLIIIAAVAAMVAAVVLSLFVRALWPIVALYVLQVLTLLVAPPIFVHYGALVAVPAAILVGAAVGVLLQSIKRLGSVPASRALGVLLGVAVVVGLAALADPQAHATKETAMPRRIQRLVQQAPGCITFDTPSPALALGVVGRNIQRGCPLVVDLGGASYGPTLRTRTARSHDKRWQPYALSYLRSGTMTIIDRFGPGFGFSHATVATVSRWPELARHGHLRVRRPLP
ncbi:MAG: hypothetical protein J2P23_06190 [Microlunatus sp.]|nr:hypothetical protein [Microlunatus sp.]